MGLNKVIALLGEPIYSEDYSAADGNIKPGHLVEFLAAGTVQRNGTAAVDVPRSFAMERDEMGKTILDAYAAGDTVKVGTFSRGMHVHARIATGQNIAKGAFLEAAADGTLKVWAAGTRLAKALEAVNNASGAEAFIRVEIV